MALSVSTNIDGRKTIDTQGLKVVHADVVFLTADYSTGIDLESIKSKLGVKSIVAVIAASIRAFGSTIRPDLQWQYDVGTGVGNKKLRFFVASTGIEVAGGAPLVNNDTLRVTLLGY